MKFADKKEKRAYYRPFRCIGGFILFILIFNDVMNGLLELLVMLGYSLGVNSGLWSAISDIIIYGFMLYAYYIGYRIFFINYQEIPLILHKIRKNKFHLLLDLLLGFIAVKACWVLWEDFGPVIIDTNVVYHFDISDLPLTIYTVLLAPVIEEVVFRQWILDTCDKYYGHLVAIVICGLTFGLFHETYYQSVPAIFIGMIFGYLDVKYHSIIPSFILHIVNNTLSVVEQYVVINEPRMIFLYAGIGIILLVIVVNIKKLWTNRHQILTTLNLIVHSISYMVFIVLTLVMIVLDFVGNIS